MATIIHCQVRDGIEWQLDSNQILTNYLPPAEKFRLSFLFENGSDLLSLPFGELGEGQERFHYEITIMPHHEGASAWMVTWQPSPGQAERSENLEVMAWERQAKTEILVMMGALAFGKNGGLLIHDMLNSRRKAAYPEADTWSILTAAPAYIGSLLLPLPFEQMEPDLIKLSQWIGLGLLAKVDGAQSIRNQLSDN